MNKVLIADNVSDAVFKVFDKNNISHCETIDFDNSKKPCAAELVAVVNTRFPGSLSLNVRQGIFDVTSRGTTITPRLRLDRTSLQVPRSILTSSTRSYAFLADLRSSKTVARARFGRTYWVD